MANTGYKLQNGTDLIDIFRSYVSGGAQAALTGFQISGGTDLNAVFAPYVSGGAQAALTGFQIEGGIGLNAVFALPISFKLSTSSLGGGPTKGICSANNGIGYCSTSSSLLYKTINYGLTWTSIAISGKGDGGITTNAANNALILFRSTETTAQPYISFIRSIDGGGTWSNGMPGTNDLACGTMARNATGNPVIAARIISDINYQVFNFLDAGRLANTLSNWRDGDRPSTLSGSSAMSDGPNFFATVTTGYRVYRNPTQNVAIANGVVMPPVTIESQDGGGQNSNFIGTCCNSDNSVNLIVNRTHTTGGRIYRTTSWSGIFRAVDGSPIELWCQIATSSAGNVACAIADSKIYVSFDTGLTWKNIAYNVGLAGGETFRFVTVSPDEKFISVATTSPRIFYCIL